jgi:tyrosine-protein kinase Etk/Wzc
VDADLRRGKLHRFFGGPRGPGLSEIVSGQGALEEVARKTELQGFELVSTGKLPPNPSELLASQRFKTFLEDASKKYDCVVVDAPPVLAVTDAALIGAHAATNLLVLRAGRHPAREVLAAVRALANAGVRVNGAVINDVPSGLGSRYARYAYGYHYNYDYRGSSDDDA